MAETILVEIPGDTVRLSGIVDIRNWLLNVNPIALEQFAIDWVEKYVDKAQELLGNEGIEVDDDTFRAATHYEAQTVLQVLRPTALCYPLFVDLEILTRQRIITNE